MASESATFNIAITTPAATASITETTSTSNVSTKCQGCGVECHSRNGVFKHLRDTAGACLSKESYQEFLQYVHLKNRSKTLVLYGYLPSDDDAPIVIKNGDDAARVLHSVMEEVSGNPDYKSNHHDGSDSTNVPPLSEFKVNRSYGWVSRTTEIVAQDDGTGAITEVMVAKLPPLSTTTTAVAEWLDAVNDILRRRYAPAIQIRILGRLPMKFSKFNAEMDLTRRRVEYLLPADFLFPNNPLFPNDRRAFFDAFRSFSDAAILLPTSQQERSEDDDAEPMYPNSPTLNYLFELKKKMQLLTTHIIELNVQDAGDVMEKSFNLKKRKKMKQATNMSTDIVSCHNTTNVVDDDSDLQPRLDVSDMNDAVMTEPQEQSSSNAKERKTRNKEKKNNRSGKNNNTKKKQNLLKRKRYHNFTPTVMAHEFLSYRRLDRFYHRATLRYDNAFSSPTTADCAKRPYIVLSMNADLFLNGQAARVIGVFIALATAAIDTDFVDCVFDEQYPHLVPTPAAPLTGLYAGEAHYMTWEGKTKCILAPRRTNLYPDGWNSDDTLRRVHEWQDELREHVAVRWMKDGVDDNDTGALMAAKSWFQKVLEPWSKRANLQLQEYRAWKASRTATLATATCREDASALHEESNNSNKSSDNDIVELARPLPAIESVDSSVPDLFKEVLYWLRHADSSGLWPSSTPKRQLVMISKPLEETATATSSLSVAHLKAKSNKELRSSAYSYVEGEGGASGSFSVGAMPGEQCIQPKSNQLFPELMKAAFELEIALCPNREPSSTIAINRNAQFRPHTDVGAGAGQSTSLIVGLGTYVGGELVVEGDRKDIRYKAVEFNGWKQRHWTMPFRGERFSLVWFTPKGCEGVRGIDLCKS